MFDGRRFLMIYGMELLFLYNAEMRKSRVSTFGIDQEHHKNQLTMPRIPRALLLLDFHFSKHPII